MSTDAVDVVTFGCRLNIVESEAMRREALAAGHQDLTIVNSCAVTAEAARQSRQAIRRIRRDHHDRRIVVTGCAAETDAGVFRAMPEIDAILRNADKAAPATWRSLPGAQPGDVPLPSQQVDAAEARHTRGFVDIQNGCDHRCTFCIIPAGRGASRSRPVADVVRRVEALVESGTQDVVLTGVDITSYGADLHGQPTLGQLVRTILAGVPALPRLRLSSLDCIETDPMLMDCFAEPRLMPHLHLSVQAGSDLILKRMKRRHSRHDVIAFCRAVRAIRPDMAFGADIIAGFPTETEEMFADTLDLIDACGFGSVHTFPFSARPGTPAARMPAVPSEVVRSRAAKLRMAGERRLRLHLDHQVGRRLSVLAERDGRGHAEDFSRVRLPAGTRAGTIVTVSPTSHDGTVLQCETLAGRQPSGNHTTE